MKANSSLAILALLAKAGAGFNIVSGGELYRVLQAGGDPAKVVFSGVGKTADEVEYALANDIHSFNCESESELALIDAMAARRGVTASFALRVNPDVDASTHPYISTGLSQHKFGIALAEAAQVYDRSRRFPRLSANGVSWSRPTFAFRAAAAIENAAGLSAGSWRKAPARSYASSNAATRLCSSISQRQASLR